MTVPLSGTFHTSSVHATCRTVGCPRRGRDALPTLGSCPGCSRPLSRFKGATASSRPLTRRDVDRAVGAGLRIARQRRVQVGAASSAGLAVVMLAPWPVAMAVPAALYAGTAFLVRRGPRLVREHRRPWSTSTPLSSAPSGSTGSYFADVDARFTAPPARPAQPTRPVPHALSTRGEAA
jgi:hypothetical protein